MPQLIEPEPSWHPEDIWNCLHMPYIDVDDMAHVVGQMELRLHEDGGRTQQLLDNHLFRQWMGRGGSSRLLVHGEYQPPHDVSPLSVLCTILSYTFRDPGVPRTIGLVFFCGRHQKWDMFQGASALIRSLIAQLMTQFGFGSIPASPDIHLKDIEGEDLDKLCEPFSILVRKLPSNMRIFCLIDGISLYENDIFLHEMSTAVMSLVRMADQLLGRHEPTFKLLITSPQPTREVRRVFSDPNTLVHMKSFPNAGSNMRVPSMQNHLRSGMN
ncbi:hypothetical protein LQW54_007324 [Pestalotiopsis sp. IQ-011]